RDQQAVHRHTARRRGSRRALLHRNRADPLRHRRSSEQGSERRPLRVLYRAGTGVLMRRTVKILAWTLGALIALPLLVVAFLFIAANADWGRRLVEHAIDGFSGGRVAVSGLRGHFPDDLSVARLELRD